MEQIEKFLFIIVFVVVFSGSRCTYPLLTHSEDTIRIISYNVENIFDAVDDGSEYDEYDPGKGNWDESLYNTRLVNLSEVIKTSCRGGPDIIALQEIENVHVADDLVKLYLKGMGYTSIVVTEKEKSAVQIGIISRMEFTSVMVHEVSMEGTGGGRPILEVSIKTDAGTLFLFNNHWKSRLGGSEKTEILRRQSAFIIRRRMKEIISFDSAADIIILGDLNENYDEYFQAEKAYRTALMPISSGLCPETTTDVLFLTDEKLSLSRETASFLLYTPWTAYHGRKGTYYFHGKWETIDHVILSYGLTEKSGYLFSGFSIPELSFLLTADQTPFRWSKTEKAGYSDHLPVMVTIRY